MTNVEDALKKLSKKYGDRSVIKLGDASVAQVDAIPTGSLALDTCIGVGGVPRGRIVEIMGWEGSAKTTVCLHCAANAQKAGLNVAYIDVENAVDPIYAANLGVNVDDLYFSQPNSAEEALDIAEQLIRSGGFGLVIVDSVAALTPRAEDEGEMGQNHMGLQARLMSQAMRKLQSIVKKTNTCLFFVNQFRMKIGVVYGCLHADTMIPLVDGRRLTIREIVDGKIEGDVWSLDESNNVITPSKIIGWHNNGNVVSNEDYIHIETTSINGGGRFGITVTPYHMVMSNDKWVKASDVKIGDSLTSKYTQIVNGSLRDFLNGTMVGDCHASIRNKNTGTIKIRDNENIEYTKWKIEKLSPFFTFTKIEVNSGVMYYSNYLYEIAKIKRDLGNRDPLYFLKNFSKLGLAIWFMDDAHFDDGSGHSRYILSIKRIKNTSKMQEVKSVFESLGYPCSMNIKNGSFIFSGECTDKIASDICEYVPECMQHKLPEKHRGKYKNFTLNNNPEIVSDNVEVIAIRNASKRQMRQVGKYDLTVYGNHNYFAGGVNNGVLVHNSPETTSGGNALKYAASVRIQVRRKSAEDIKEDGVKTGITIAAKVIKNKVAPPFRECEFEVLFGEGISKYGELIDLGVAFDHITKRGAFYSVGDIRLGQGKDASKQYLKEHPEMSDDLEAKIRQSIKESRRVTAEASEVEEDESDS